MARAAIIGAAGYAGAELMRILSHHPDFDLAVATSDADAGQPIASVYPALTGIAPQAFSPHEDPAVLACDVAFLAVPHKAGMKHAARLAEAGVSVVDLSADFRFSDRAVYEKVYGVEHTAPDLLAGAAFGQPELTRPMLANLRERHDTGEAVVVGNAGCYPTAVSLACVPLVRAGLADPRGTIIADCLSGVTGAGRKATARTHFCSANDNAEAYGFPIHRHTPEMAMELALAARTPYDDDAAIEGAPGIVFTPHLIPANRGMLATAHIPLVKEASDADVRAAFEHAYAESPFVTVLPEGTYPRTASVTGTNNAHIGIAPIIGPTHACAAAAADPAMATITCVIDNLGKGAAGQAVQCANIIFGFNEAAGLENLAMPI